jgi:hypothetical protein
MNWTKRTILILLFLASQAFSQGTPQASSYLKQAEISETEGTVHIVANSPRPLTQVLEALQKKYGWFINYEDPQFTSKLDTVEVADPRAHAPSSQILPAGGRFTLEFPAPPAQPPSPQPGAATEPGQMSNSAQSSPAQSSSTPSHPAQLDFAQEEKTLRLVVDAYNHSDNPGRFELRTIGEGNLTLVGTAAHDAKGQIASQKPVLDSTLTLARGQRMATTTIELLCQRLTALRGIKVSLGVYPRNLLDHTPVTVGAAKKASARDLLLQTLAHTRGSYYLHLLYDPSSKGYYLDIHSIHPAAQTIPPAQKPS